MDLIGKNFGSYKIESKIGEGGMGVVYRARDTDLDRPVAIKMVLESGDKDGSQSTEAVARFLREAKAASRLQHPSIVHIYKFGVEGNTRYLVMEFIEGKNLRAVIGRRPMPVERICEIAAQVADGLSVAHEMGVVHRDLKVENIMLTPRGQAKILDFGLAKVVEQVLPSEETTVDENYKTQLGTVLGTVSSMSPEQALGRDVDSKSDIFSLGVVLYEMAIGLNPFLGPTPQATLAKILHHNPELVSLINPAIPPELERLIHLCLRKDPKQRPSAQEVTKTCRRLLSSVSQWAASGEAAAASPSPAPLLVANPTPQPKPPVSGTKPPSAPAMQFSQVPAVTSTVTLARLKVSYRLIKAARILVALATITVPLSFFFYMLVGAQIIRPELVQGTAMWTYVQAIVLPVLAEAEKIFTFRPVVNGWNLMLAGLGIVVLVVRHGLMLPFEKWEFHAKGKLARARSSPAQVVPVPVSDRAVNNRLTLLRQYSEEQNTSGNGRRLVFLSIDIVGWPRMTQGEDPLVAEHALAEYKKFVDRALRGNAAWKTAFTAEGILSAFEGVDNAVAAAQSILKDLPWFNDSIHKLRTPFHLRMGLHAGQVDFPEERSLEDFSDEVIDVACQMQKAAPPDSLWLSGEVLALAANNMGFDMVTSQQVADRTTYEWRASAVQPVIPVSRSIGA